MIKPIDIVPEPCMAHLNKLAFLTVHKGMEVCGAILYDPKTGERATVDDWGLVQWWTVDGTGKMIPKEDK